MAKRSGIAHFASVQSPPTHCIVPAAFLYVVSGMYDK